MASLRSTDLQYTEAAHQRVAHPERGDPTLPHRGRSRHQSAFAIRSRVVADRVRSQHVTDLLSQAARDGQYDNVLFLIPDWNEPGARNLDFYNPFPGASEICRYPELWPGVLFWQPSGDSLFLPVDTAFDNLPRIAANIEQPLNILKNQIPDVHARQSVRLLHLSDLHCGRRETRQNEMYLLTSINRVFHDKYDEIIISGDLFDSPFVWNWEEYKQFLQTLQLLTRHDPITVKGNHDVRILGNAIWRIGTFFKPASEVEQRASATQVRLFLLQFRQIGQLGPR
jgi:Calcineurin-like phosphoesterase